MPHFSRLAILFLCFPFAGCGILFGNVKPATEKSKTTASLDLERETGGAWKKIDVEPGENPEEQDRPDVAFQSQANSSIISLTSSCRPSVKEVGELRVFTHEPFLGVTNVSFSDQKETSIDGNKALVTTVQGILEGTETRMRSIVLRKDDCLYDLLFASSPRHFSDDEPTFQKFVSGLRLR